MHPEFRVRVCLNMCTLIQWCICVHACLYMCVCVCVCVRVCVFVCVFDRSALPLVRVCSLYEWVMSHIWMSHVTLLYLLCACALSVSLALACTPPLSRSFYHTHTLSLTPSLTRSPFPSHPLPSPFSISFPPSLCTAPVSLIASFSVPLSLALSTPLFFTHWEHFETTSHDVS